MRVRVPGRLSYLRGPAGTPTSASRARASRPALRVGPTGGASPPRFAPSFARRRRTHASRAHRHRRRRRHVPRRARRSASGLFAPARARPQLRAVSAALSKMRKLQSVLRPEDRGSGRGVSCRVVEQAIVRSGPDRCLRHERALRGMRGSHGRSAVCRRCDVVRDVFDRVRFDPLGAERSGQTAHRQVHCERLPGGAVSVRPGACRTALAHRVHQADGKLDAPRRVQAGIDAQARRV